MQRRHQRRKKIWLIPTIIVSIFLLIYVAGTIFYASHILPGTKLGELSIANCSAQSVESKLNTLLDTYTLTITGREGLKEIIAKDDVNLKYDVKDFGKEVIDKQSAFAWVTHLFSSEIRDDKFEITYDENMLNNLIENFSCMKAENIINPVDACMTEYQSGVGFSIVPEIMGNEIDKEVFVQKIDYALKNIESNLNIDENNCYVLPKVYSDTPELVEKLNYYNKFVTSKITYTFDNDVIVLDGDTIYDWLIFKKNGKIKIDENKVKDFVNSLGSKYDTIFRKRTFKTSYGNEVEIAEGDYGWWMNRGQEVTELIKLIKKGSVTDREPVYYQKAARYGAADYGNTYVEINLTAQHLFVYKKGKVVLESDFVSGKETKSRKTPPGVYGITYKERDATLVGEDYETPVSYWMPFNGSIGLHDATWRNKFGANIYLKDGSHGCINLPFYIAQKIYDIVEKGTPVICYYLPGTQSHSITSQGDEEIAQFVVDAIERIGKVERNRKDILIEFLERVRTCYKDLSYNQKKYVTNLSKLEKAEKELEELLKE